MDNPRSEKVAVVDEVRQHFSDSDAAIFTEYRGLKVKDLATLRRSLTPLGGEYKVYKNTLVRFAARDAGLPGLDALLVGPTAVAFVKGDAAAAAKALRDFARTQPLLVIKGGVLGDKVLTAADTTALAELPSRDVLLARIAGGLAAPLQQMAGLLQALPRNLAYGLSALLDQRVAAGETIEPAGGVPAEAHPAPEAAESVTEETPAAETPAAETPAAESVTEETPAAETPAAETPAASSEPAQASAAEPLPADPSAPDAEVAVALDDATSPALAAEAVDPAPPE